MPKTTIIRLAIALIFGGIIGGLCLYGTGAGLSSMRMMQRLTEKNLRLAQENVESYRKRYKRWPTSPFELKTLSKDYFSPTSDAWNRPLQYKEVGNKVVVYSLGQDGKIGGIGLDFDISSDNPHPPEAQPVFLNILSAPAVWPLTACALLCGVLAGVIGFQAIRPHDLTYERLPDLIFKIIFTSLSVGFVSLFVTTLHIPSGH